MTDFENKIICGNCIDVLGKSKGFANLIFADPPFNIGYQYDKYKDKLKKDKYISWTKEWMKVCVNVLDETGSFYIAIGDDFAAHVRIIGDELGLTLRNWIIWHYTFGQQTKLKFARSHTHIFYFVKDAKEFTFNDEIVRVHSDRQLVYKDKRANRAGKMPDDVWTHFPRVCGTFKEREGWHPCQMPESLLAKIVRLSSNAGDWVLDPFSGSGTTAVVAAKLKRIYTGIELSDSYAKETRKRIKACRNRAIEGEGAKNWTEEMDLELKWLYHENGIPTGQLNKDDLELSIFTAKFNSIMHDTEHQFAPNEIMNRLIRVRKSGKLGALGMRTKA